MENVLLIIHLILAVFLIAVVLLQRSEGGALGIGGGGGGGGLVSGRSATTALAKVTWGLAAAFIATSLTLTILAAQQAGSRSVIDRLEAEDAALPDPLAPPAAEDGTLSPELRDLLAPAPGIAPPAADDGVSPPSAGGGVSPPSAGGGVSPPSADDAGPAPTPIPLTPPAAE